MNKAELVDAIARKAGGSKAMADIMIDAFIDAVTGSLKKGENVTLVGFGTFSQGKRAARAGAQPSNRRGDQDCRSKDGEIFCWFQAQGRGQRQKIARRELKALARFAKCTTVRRLLICVSTG
jgi:DNA-binding protein HU-beta